MRQNLSRGAVVAAAATGIMSLYASPALADSNAAATASDSPGVASGNNIQIPVNVPLNLCGNTVDVVAALNPAFGNACVNGSGSHDRHAAPHHDVRRGSGSGLGRDAGHRGADRSGGGHGAYGGHGDEHRGHGGGSGYGDSGYGHSRHGGSGYGSSGYGDSGDHHGDGNGSSAYGETHGSPGVLSGNSIQVPVDIPLNLCGNSVNVLGLGNSAYGNECGNDQPHVTPPPPVRHTPPPTVHEQPPTKTPYTPPVTVHRQYTPPPTLAETGSEGLFAASAISAALLVGGALLYRRGRVAARP
ncbi:chaplin [Streptomyces triticiradicis]|uniref:Chaplin n=1 Tax=Streptomyces triticiradicis TaxID=2651189 RepID=A0A7J5D3E2_9ACTN|nr:chaplin [Streptomyces triticiradicis]KAB1978226.1 chaplin [Streptomyces triticiradicis]